MQSELTGAAAPDSPRHKQIQALRGANKRDAGLVQQKVNDLSAQLIDELFYRLRVTLIWPHSPLGEHYRHDCGGQMKLNSTRVLYVFF